MTRHEDECAYCGTIYAVEFDHEDDELMYCPACGEAIPEFEDELEDLNFNEDYED